MNKTSLFLILGILLIGLVSASPLSCILDDDVSNLTAKVTQDSSIVTFYVNTAGQSCDNIDVTNFLEENGLDLDSYDFPIDFNSVFISDVLDDFNFKVSYLDSTNVPQFSSLDVFGAISTYDSYGDFAASLSTKSAVDILLDWAREKGYLEDDYTITELMLNLTLLDEVVYDYIEGIDTMWGNAQFEKNGNYWTFTYDKGYGDLDEANLTKIKNAIDNR